MAALATPVQQTQQENHHQVNSHGSQNGSQDFKVQLCSQLSNTSENYNS